MHTARCCHVPIIHISDYEYGSPVKSAHFHLAPLEAMKSTLPYPHRHDFYHVVWVRHGHGTHVIDSVEYSVCPDSIFFMGPGQIHDFDLSEDAAGHAVSFSADFFSFKVRTRHAETEVPVYDFERMPAALYLDPAQAAALRPLIDGIAAEYDDDSPGREDAIWSYLCVFLIKAARLGGMAPDDAHAPRGVLLSRRFKALLEKHFHTVTDAAAYARMLHVTERALNDATRQALGATAGKLIRERVMLEARRLLLHTEESVAEISAQLAFEDPAYFSRCFKKHTGRSPIEFRRSLAKLNI
jgi:AraC-like DNA-binding protein